METVNPYESPVSRDSVATAPRTNEPRLPLRLLVTGAIAYHSFAVLLLTSSPSDQSVGLLFLVNTPIIAMWNYGVWRNHRRAYLWGPVAAGVQIVIHRLAFGGFAVNRVVMDAVMITSFISLVMISLACVCYVFRPIVQ